MLTQRQQTILEVIIQEYIRGAEPVSSQLLEKEYDFGIKGAMIRREMQELCDLGYLFQPHTSAGRVPTEKGYRFYVDKLLSKELTEDEEDSFKFGFLDEIDKETDPLRMFHLLTKKVALLVSSFALGYMSDMDIIWKEGWEEILREPEFQSSEPLLKFVAMLENLERQLGRIKLKDGIKVYIGSENPFARTEDFSIVLTSCMISDRQKGIIAVVGPTRMQYNRIIKALMSLKT